MSTLYHLPDPSHRARFLDRAAEAVRGKACKLYRLDASTLAIPPGTQKTIDTQLQLELTNKDYWPKRRTKAMADSGLTEEAAAGIEAAARMIIQRYLEAFYLRRRLIHQQAQSARYPEPQTRQSMADLYINHRCNQGEAMLEKCGLTPAAAHALNGTLIGISIQAYQVYDEDVSYVTPMQGSSRSKTPQQIAERIQELRGFQRDFPKAKLERNYRGDEPSR